MRLRCEKTRSKKGVISLEEWLKEFDSIQTPLRGQASSGTAREFSSARADLNRLRKRDTIERGSVKTNQGKRKNMELIKLGQEKQRRLQKIHEMTLKTSEDTKYK